MTSVEPLSVLDTPEGEIALLSALIQARPVGLQKHWAMLSIMRMVESRLGEGRVTNEEVWSKLGTLYDLKLLDEDAADLQEAEEAEAQLGAEGVGILTNTAAATAITAARKRRRRSSIHDKPQMERPDFNLIERPSFQEEFEKRRRRTSPSPGAHLEVADEVKSPGVAKSPSELSVLDDKDHATPTNVLEEQEARAAADENTQPDVGEGPFSPTRSTRSSRGNQRTAVPGPSNRSARNRNSSPSIKDVKEEEKEDQAVQRGEEEEEEAPSESASTLSALSDGEGGVIGHLEEDLVEGDAEEAQGEGDDTIDAGTDENIEDDTETGTSVGPEDTPYKSPKGDSHSFPARDSTNSSLTASPAFKKKKPKGTTETGDVGKPSSSNAQGDKTLDGARTGKTRSTSPDKDGSKDAAAASKRLSGAAAASVKKRMENSKKGSLRRK
ncbi:MAG: hypothetical protein CYPHOPRED_003206 [Cyphobasidiales sp. Tagirdzhanova-0007]|nr:MAG: hypothetical protein CYPHOPRED_003206 [Cyphobasidiales sp. Tagirdzhanova-0007]